MLDTYFAPAAKATSLDLHRDIAMVASHPILTTMLHSVSGLLAVLNEQRQILAVNQAFLDALGITDLDAVLSLRPGEAMDCVHAQEPPNGCGTTQYCVTCGAAIAMVTSLRTNVPVEKRCALTVNRQGKPTELCLSVRAHPCIIDGHRLLLLFLQDITKEHFLHSLERTFFHDICNMLNGIMGYSELYCHEHGNPPEIRKVNELALRLSQTVALHRTLANLNEATLKPNWQSIGSEQILAELTDLFAHHPAAKGKFLTATNHAPGQCVHSDITLLLRVLSNMTTNALEASHPPDEVRIAIEPRPGGGLLFSVWNPSVIPEAVRLRIFQQNFSTKSGLGRGFGTFSMKLFGEQYLGGEVSFTSNDHEGTTFRFAL